MEPSHNPFSVLSQLGSDHSPINTSNSSTLPLIDQINSTQSASATVIKPSSVFPSKQSAFAHYHASSSAAKRAKTYFLNHCPKLAGKTAITRSSFLKNTVQGGSLVQFTHNSELLKIFQFAKLEPFVFPRNKVVCHSLVKEFYCNLEDRYGLNGEKFFTTVLDGTPVLISHDVISKAVGFHYKVSKQPIQDITQATVFDKNEFHLYISTFCKSDVPDGRFDSDEALPYELFAPEFQPLALIYRANVFPKPNHDKLFTFLDLKIMFLILTDKINFNLPYMILLNMINAPQLSFMPYGMLLSCIFTYLKLDVSCYPSHKVSALISEKTFRKQLPLAEYMPPAGLNVHKCMTDHTLVVAKLEEFQKSVGTEMEEMRGMLMRSLYRVNNLMEVVNGLVARAQVLEQSTENLFVLIKRMNLEDEIVGKGTDEQMCESVNGKFAVGSEAMMEGK